MVEDREVFDNIVEATKIKMAGQLSFQGSAFYYLAVAAIRALLCIAYAIDRRR